MSPTYEQTKKTIKYHSKEQKKGQGKSGDKDKVELIKDNSPEITQE